MEISSKTLLQGDTPRLIDEWHTIPELWDTIRNEVDKRGALFMMVITAVGPYAYQRPDGVFVVPIGCLKD